MITVTAIFTQNSGDPATGLTLADIDLYLYRRAISSGAVTMVWDGVNPTEEVGGGIYTRSYSSEDLETYEYFAYAQYTGAEDLDSDYALMSASFQGDTGAVVWGYSTRTLTQSAASVTAAVSGSDLTIRRGDTFSASLTGLGSLSGYVSLDFAVKVKKSDSDDDAIVRIRLNASGSGDGLLRLNKQAASNADNGSITIDDAGDGDITITLAAAETQNLVKAEDLYYDVQVITASAVTTLTEGNCDVTEDVMRAVT